MRQLKYVARERVRLAGFRVGVYLRHLRRSVWIRGRLGNVDKGRMRRLRCLRHCGRSVYFFVEGLIAVAVRNWLEGCEAVAKYNTVLLDAAESVTKALPIQ